MNKFFLITKINILQIFNFSRNNNSKFKSERRKKNLKSLFVLLIVFYIIGYIFYFTKSLLSNFVQIGKPLFVIAFLFVICTFYIFFANLFRIKNILFDFKDYDLLMSLPIKRTSIITSKIVSLYIVNLIYTLIIMLPGYFAYILEANMPNDVLFFLLLFTIPIIPILASSIIGIFLAWIASFFRNKNIGSYVVNLLIIFFVLFISFKTSNLNEEEIVNQSVNMVNSFSNYYPFTTIFVDLLVSVKAINIIIYFVVPIFLMMIFIILINVVYIPLRNRLLRENVKSNYEIKGYKKNSILKGLYLKEVKKYFSNSLYVINTAFPCIMLIALIIMILLSKNSFFSNISNVIDFKELIVTNIFLIISMVCALSSTTHASISLEGKSLWIMKSIPVNSDIIFLSKILVNLTISIPVIIINGVFFGFYLKLPLVDLILLFILPFAYSLFTAVSGLILNLLFPKFDFDNEIRVIKQSLPVFLSMVIGILMVVVPFMLLNNNIILITSIIIIVDIVLISVLHYNGKEIFRKL